MEPQLISESLDRICKSASFNRSHRLQRFLRYVVDKALSHPAEPLKEYTIAIAVYEKDTGFDPRLDPIVRVEASRLRLRLMEYYSGAGRDEEIAIDIPKGSYIPVFRILHQQAVGPAAGNPNKSCASIAVLPFENSSADPEYDYLSESLAESLTTWISRTGSVQVCPTAISRHFTSRFDPSAVATELSVDCLVTGSFTIQKNTVVVRFEVIDALQKRLIWGSKVSGEIDTAEILEDWISRTICEEVAQHVGVSKRSSTAVPSIRPEAYRLYVKGRYVWNKRTKAGLMAAVEFFRRSLEIDPTYAAAYAGLADSYIALGTFGALAPGSSFPRGIAAALRALDLNPELAEAEVSLATAKAFYETDWRAAGNEFRTAIHRAPNYATGHHWYGCYLLSLGRMDEAISVLNCAQELDPLSPIISVQLASAYYFDRQHTKSCEICRGVLELDPQFWVAHWFMGMALEQSGQLEDALKELQLAVDGSEQNALAVAALAHCLAATGQNERAEAQLSTLRVRGQSEYVPGYALALILLSVGRMENALDELEAARRENSPMLAMFLGVDPRWDSIRAEARFIGLIESLHLPQMYLPAMEGAQNKNR